MLDDEYVAALLIVFIVYPLTVTIALQLIGTLY
jgi:hypothetical protein